MLQKFLDSKENILYLLRIQIISDIHVDSLIQRFNF